MRDYFSPKLKSLGFTLPDWCIPPSEELVSNFEKQFGLVLPVDYRAFLVLHGGVIGTARCRFQEPTPCGFETCIDSFYGFTSPDRRDNVTDSTQLISGAPDIVDIGGNLIGSMFWLRCTGRDEGNVYMHDHEGRFGWTDEMFHESFPNLSPVVQHYLDLRREGKLPQKRKGYEHVYRLARNFGEFVDHLEPGVD